MRHWKTFVLALIIFSIYVYCIPDEIVFGDSGELATAVHVFGVAHSTGYPLYIIIGKLFSFLPFGSLAFKLGLMSSSFSALAGILIYFSAYLILKNRPSSLVAQGAAGFSPLLWSQSVIPEVYSLSICIISLLIMLLILYYREQSDSLACLLGLVFGFGLTNHMMVIALIPGILFILRDVKRATLFFLFSIMPLFLYLHLPLNTATALNYGDLTVPENFIRHVTASEFLARTDFQATDLLFPISLVLFLFKEFSVLSGLAIIGAFLLFKRERDILLFMTFIVITNAVLAIKNLVIITEPHLIPAIVVACILLAAGARFLQRYIPKYAYALSYTLIVLMIAFTYTIHPQVNRRDDISAWQYSEYISTQMEGKSIYIGRTDDDLFPLFYFKYVEGIFPDTLLLFYRRVAPMDEKPLRLLSKEEVVQGNVRIYNFVLANLDRYDIYTSTKGHENISSYNAQTFPLKVFNEAELVNLLRKQSLEEGDLYFYR
jgi:hypothetical protein